MRFAVSFAKASGAPLVQIEYGPSAGIAALLAERAREQLAHVFRKVMLRRWVAHLSA